MKTVTLNRTQQVIESQLLENTGKSFLDSGDHYGRHYERNRKTGIDFNEGLRIDHYSVIIPIQVFMETMFDFTDDCEQLEQSFNESDIELCYSNRDEIKEHLESLGYQMDGEWFNTCNWDNDLSQDLQGVIFQLNRQYFIIVETHNGCDIRGGYSDARIYQLNDIDYFYLGQQIEVTNPEEPGGNPFESLYDAEQAGMKWNEETERYEFPDGSEAEFYTSALGF